MSARTKNSKGCKELDKWCCERLCRHRRCRSQVNNTLSSKLVPFAVWGLSLNICLLIFKIIKFCIEKKIENFAFACYNKRQKRG